MAPLTLRVLCPVHEVEARVRIVATEEDGTLEPGDVVAKRQLIARGITHIYFQANVWIFTGLILIVGIAMGTGSAAVYKYIPDYFPSDVGVVGG